MATSAPNEAQMQEALAEMAKASVSSLKNVFAMPPAGKSWEEIEEAMAQGKSLGEICGLSNERCSHKSSVRVFRLACQRELCAAASKLPVRWRSAPGQTSRIQPCTSG